MLIINYKLFTDDRLIFGKASYHIAKKKPVNKNSIVDATNIRTMNRLIVSELLRYYKFGHMKQQGSGKHYSKYRKRSGKPGVDEFPVVQSKTMLYGLDVERYRATGGTSAVNTSTSIVTNVAYTFYQEDLFGGFGSVLQKKGEEVFRDNVLEYFDNFRRERVKTPTMRGELKRHHFEIPDVNFFPEYHQDLGFKAPKIVDRE